MSIQANFPAIKPTLLLDFANTKQLDPRITFARASTATYYGTQTAKAEENLFVQSQAFNETSVWASDRLTVTANTSAAPDGTTTADTITNTTATGTHVVNQSSGTSGYSIVSGLTYTISVFAKKSTNDFFQITTFNASNTLGTGRANFNLATGVVGSVDGGTSTITDVGSGWYRCTYTVTASASGSVNIYFGIITTSTAARFESYTGLGTEAVFLWGAQVEQRSAVTAYTVTTTQPITNYIPQLLTAASGVARFDHNPITDESLGLLIEEQRTNLLTYSEQFDNAAWTKTRSSITANTIVAPDGALTGDKLVEDTSNNTHVVFAADYPATNTTLTISVYAKAAERSHFNFSVSNFLTGYGGALFNLANGTFSSVLNTGDYTNTSASITPVGNGWYRCSITTTKGSANSVNRWIIELSNGTTTSYTGNGYSGIYVWGAQLEAGTFASSYIQTVASQVTRAADAASMTGTNFSSWYNQAEGTLYAEAQVPTDRNFSGTFRHFANISTSSSNNSASGLLVTGLNSFAFEVRDGATIQASLSSGTNTGIASRLAGAYQVNNFAFSANGAAAVTDTSGQAPVNDPPTQIVFGRTRDGNVSGVLNGTIKKLTYYPLRVSNAQLQALTS